MKDHDIIQHIRAGNRNKPIKELYKEFPKIKATIVSSGGSHEHAEEIFHDALILLIEKVNEPSFELRSKLSTFLFGIAKFLWQNEQRRLNKKQELEWNKAEEISEKDIDYDYERELKLQKMEKIVASLSEKCQGIFEAFYFKNESMEKIAKALGFSSVNSAKTQKYKCMEQAIRLASDTQL